jgi:ribosome-binding protein aMBF1 (putative translation factor)
MDVSFDQEFPVGQRDRISVDVNDLREQIEQCRDDAAWSELPLAAKIRVLVKERLAQMEAEKQQKNED